MGHADVITTIYYSRANRVFTTSQNIMPAQRRGGAPAGNAMQELAGTQSRDHRPTVTRGK
ncbi:hypothetical protein [Vibrio lentus]|uniref:hypothetical protein n=1 Tax=Vibrio lentus TaxID=136468 RepID=UPI0039AF67A5